VRLNHGFSVLHPISEAKLSQADEPTCEVKRMSQQTGVVDTTKTTEEVAIVVPDRAETLKAIAGDVMKTFADGAEEPKAVETPGEKKPGEVDGKPDALSQSDKAAEDGKTVTVPATEPAWSQEKLDWFATMEAAKTPEEIEAAQKAQPEFSAEEVEWLKAQNAAAEQPAGEAVEDHIKDDADLKGKLDAPTQERINKRIGKEVAKTKAAAEKAEQLAAENAELKQQLQARPTAAVPANAGPLADVHDTETLQARRHNAETALDQADDLLNRIEDSPADVEAVLREAKVVLKAADGTDDYSPAAMKKYLTGIKRNADRILTRDIPKRLEFLKAADRASTEVFERLPELKDAKSELRKQFDMVVAETKKSAPFVFQLPDWPKALALQTLGLAAWTKMAKGAAAPAVKPKRPIPVTIPAPRLQPGAVPRAKPNAVTDETATAALNGDRNARLKIISTLVPKS
jgi:hypothetical protein